jgi:uncharacterized SAM-binding protein YcdF (DUF218 family)
MVVIVPGFTPRLARQPIRLHPRARRRVVRAVQVADRLRIGWIIVSGGPVYPPGTPYVEADGMAEALAELGWPRDRIVRERSARHTCTNLRNCGRLMLKRGWTTARVVTGMSHAMYIASPALVRTARKTLGYVPGDITRRGAHELDFEPCDAVLTPGRDPLDP